MVLQEGADAVRVEQEIVTMPYYFANNNTHVHFISSEELARNHNNTATSGFVYRSGYTGENNMQHMEYALQLESNPEFTANILVACARAVSELAKEGKKGAITILDVPPALLSEKTGDQIRAEML